MAIIRKNPLFEIYFTDGHLVINNTDYKKDNRAIDIENIQSLELIKNSSFLNKFIEVTFGLNFPAKSYELRINMENGFRDIILTDCDIDKVELLIYDINQIIIKKSDFQ
ncbi:putative ubiquitin-like protein YukD [Flavobacterium nitrogenifigens]|uniref:Ubiquitin-like protein YukD n=2 Tax=Flavobacterium TaxID=237 RepID=A0ABR6Q7S1_9FLAO|nr:MULTISPECIES: hypothetical protein [Flavobacterium]MBB4800979.1 putative ubiquitin-like protein YukD [Flavobacterium nitrogenifigens]MBB6385273.1 putative ubiquitin-like protein YukD [Flavobacterium notoginsengisoli]